MPLPKPKPAQPTPQCLRGKIAVLSVEINQIGFKFMYSQFTGIKFYSAAYRLKLNEVISNISPDYPSLVPGYSLLIQSLVPANSDEKNKIKGKNMSLEISISGNGANIFH